MSNNINSLPFNELYNAYLNQVAKAREKLIADSANESLGQYEKALANKIEIALANDTEEDACHDKWDAYYRGEYEYDPKSWQIPDSVLLRVRKDILERVIKEFVSDHSLDRAHNWFPYQLISYFGTWKAVMVDGMYQPHQTILANVKLNDFAAGALLLATYSRSPLFNTTFKTFRQYNSPISPIVPLVLAGFKQSQNIPYSKWSKDKLNLIVGNDLGDAMTCEVPQLSAVELLGIRNTCLTDSTGVRAGIPNNPVSCIKLNGIGTTALAHLPKLAKYMALQTWCAHPTNLTINSIADPSNWDKHPLPLVGSDLFSTPASVKPKKTFEITTSDTPW